MAPIAQLISFSGGLQGEGPPLTAADLPVPRTGPEKDRPSGLYIHVPFCRHKCHYCDFYSFVDSQGRQGAFVDRLVEEIEAARAFLGRPLETIFVGGGTPTLLDVDSWGRLLDIFASLPTAPDVELTVEANPETVSPELLGVLAGGGVNRCHLV